MAPKQIIAGIAQGHINGIAYEVIIKTLKDTMSNE